MSRWFQASNSNYLTIPNLNLARGSTSNVSIVFNVKLLIHGVAASVFGSSNGSSEGIGVRLNSSSDSTIIQLHNGASGRSITRHIRDLPKFIAIVNDADANESRFYMGDSASTMVLEFTDTALAFAGSAIPDVAIGAHNINGSVSESMNGLLGKLAIFYDTKLNLTQIKQVAACGSALASSATRYYQMAASAAGPEPDDSPNNDDATVVGTVATSYELCNFGNASLKSRNFNGISDGLNTGLQALKGSTNKNSGYAWIWITTEVSSSRVYGLRKNSDNAYLIWDISVGASGTHLNMVVYSFDGGGATRQCEVTLPSDMRERPIFVAWVNDVTNNRFRYFWGFTPSSLTEVATGDFLTVFTATSWTQTATGAGSDLIIGAGGGSFPQYFRGILDTVGLEFDTELTIGDLQARALCGGSAGTHFWPINGTDPEDGISVITGTYIVDSICGGGEFVASNSQLMVCM